MKKPLSLISDQEKLPIQLADHKWEAFQEYRRMKKKKIKAELVFMPNWKKK